MAEGPEKDRAAPAAAPRVAALLRAGLAHQKTGRLAEAEAAYLQVMALHRRHPDALNLLGLVQYQRGRLVQALARFDEALAVAPGRAEIHNNRGMALVRLGRLDEAVAALRQALALRGDYPEASFHLGNALRLKGETAAACEAYRAALAGRPDFAAAHGNLGNLLTETGDAETGVRHLERVLALQPPTPEALNNLAAALLRLGRLEEAEVRLREALALRPAFAAALANLGRVQQARGRPEEAADSLRAALRVRPDDSEVRLALGRLLGRMRQAEAAVEHLQAAVLARPADAVAQYELGRALEETLAFTAAAQAYRRALELDPGHAEAGLQLAGTLLAMGQVPEALAQYENAVAAGRLARAAAGNRLLALNYSDALTAEEIWQAHRAFGQALEEAVAPLPPPAGHDRDPERRLRVGYVSGDFRLHSCAFFIEPLLAAHDPSAVEVACYSTDERSDAVTERLRTHARIWREVHALGDEELATLIRADGIDVLVDLAGHTGGNRIGVFAMKPAPVQVTWLGYPNTTGLSRIDYRLTDSRADPVGPADGRHSETLVRLPQVFLCYRPPAAAPEVGPLPAERNGAVTFGSFNGAPKVGPAAVALWAEILREVPDARLLMKSMALADEPVRVRYRAMFARHGIAPERVGLFPFAGDLADVFAAYGAVDIALDAFPYAGTTTTCETLWMGVPVVTLEGDRHAGRVGGSLLRCLGLEAECVAATPEEYRRKAVALARDLPRLAALRRALRPRMAASPLRDEAGFAHAVEAAYRMMWRRWCAVQG